MAKLMKPLFYNGNYNKDGKRIRVKHYKTIGDFPLWIHAGTPDKDHGRCENDKYYLLAEKNGYVFNIGETEHTLSERTGEAHLVKEWYGNPDGRREYFDENFRKGRDHTDAHKKVREHINKEQAFIAEWGRDERLQALYIQSGVDRSIRAYLDAKEGGEGFPDFVGALYLDDLDKCEELAKIKRKEREIEYQEKERQRAEQEAEAERQRVQEEQERMAEAEAVFAKGGKLDDREIIVKLADKYGVKVPIRTRGWMLNSMGEVTVGESGITGYRYYKKSKGARGSQVAFRVMDEIRAAIVS